jgi:hypothetical protein
MKSPSRTVRKLAKMVGKRSTSDGAKALSMWRSNGLTKFQIATSGSGEGTGATCGRIAPQFDSPLQRNGPCAR